MTDRDDGAAQAPHLRSAVPQADGPLAGSGAAPEPQPPAARPAAEPEPASERPQPEPASERPQPEPASERPEPEPAVKPSVEPAAAAGSPARSLVAAGHRIRVWSHRPTGRLAVPALLLAALTALSGLAGAVVVPALGDPSARTARVDIDAAPDSGERPPDATAPLPGASLTPAPPATTAVPSTPSAAPTGPDGTSPPPADAPDAAPPGRPSDVLAGWAQQVGARVDIPPGAMQAYGYAELVLAQTSPGCHLSWTTLAAIGSVESNHGRANGATLMPDGQALPQIIGLPLDGQGGRQRIADTDRGQLDGDPVLDRAVGPMQFIPSTWLQAGLDADNDGANNPHDIDDAALAAANYLCAGGRDLATAADWWEAILSYNDVRRYALAVFDKANRYGTASRT